MNVLEALITLEELGVQQVYNDPDAHTIHLIGCSCGHPYCVACRKIDLNMDRIRSVAEVVKSDLRRLLRKAPRGLLEEIKATEATK